jgi:alpha-tubulin suppressor-like RCC1 family protein
MHTRFGRPGNLATSELPARIHDAQGARTVALLVVAAALVVPAFAAPAQGPVVQVAAGDEHTCALLGGGRVQCWGDNTYGQLGDGTKINRGKPVDVLGLSSGVAAIAAGHSHTCAVTTAGAAKCWGDNWGRQLGNGAEDKYRQNTGRSTPVDVVGLSSGVTEVAAGYTHTCALTASGAMLCWGEGPGVDSGVPVPVPGLASGVVGIAAGRANSVVLTGDGRVKYWGRDGQQMVCPPGPVCYFQPVGFGTPRDASFLPGGVTAIATATGRDALYSFDYNLCALAPGGRVMCWGGDQSPPGQLASSVDLEQLAAGVSAIAMGGDHSCVLAAGGIAQCWGRNDRGQLGNGRTSLLSEGPTAVVGLATGMVEIAAGGGHTCAVSAAGDLACWGKNDKGQLGDGGAGYQSTPVLVMASPAPSYHGLWWNAPAGSEPGWGINLKHQGDTIFASWFTYDTSGRGWWLVMTVFRNAANAYEGTLYQTRGPAFDAVPYNPRLFTMADAGTGRLSFTDANNGTFEYTVKGVHQTKHITREMFGPLPACTADASPNLALATNYQDLWWAAPATSESGWGINLNHQGDTIFATWFTYDVDGSPMWLVATAPKTGPATYGGELYRTAGARFDAFDPSAVTATKVGAATFTFSDGNNATFAYTVTLAGQTVTQAKAITRQTFSGPGTTCQ